MTDSIHHRPPRKLAGSGKVFKLTSRDVEDAQRLLSLLASNEDRITIEPLPKAAADALEDQQALLRRAKELIADRRRRHEIFGRAMFGEPAWDMLLLLYVLEGEQRLTIGGLSDLARATRTTGMRWIEYLQKQQLVTRNDHPHDRRTALVELTAKGRDAIELYLSGTRGIAA